jgi:hypothetical protein
MTDYLIEMLVCQALFLGFYQFIKSEVFFKVNRLYLILSLILSMLLPLFSFSDILPGQVTQAYVQWLQPLQIGGAEAKAEPSFSEIQIQASKGFQWNIYHKIYGVGFMICLVYFLFRNRMLFKYINLNSFEDYKFTPVVIIPKTSQAFSFFDRIYIGGDIPESQQMVILEHEYQHIRKKHALDLLFVELLHLVLWFNPLIYIYKFQLRQLHEFEVDKSVSSKFSLSKYINTLLNQSFGSQNVSFVHAFSRSSELKKRIMMLRNTNKSKFSKLKYLLIIPVLALATIWSCSQDENFERELTQEEMRNLSKMFFEEVINSEPTVRDIIKEKPSLEYLLNQYDLKLKNDYSHLEEAKVSFLVGIVLISKEYRTDSDYQNIIKNEVEDIPTLASMLKKLEEQGKNSYREGFQAASFDSDSSIPYALIDNPPHPYTCEGLSADELKKCTNEFINSHVNQNFDTSKFSDLEPKRYRVIVQFKIDKTGRVTDIKTRGPSVEMEKEAQKVIESLPQMIPGEVDGEAVNVLYGLPINFVIAE